MSTNMFLKFENPSIKGSSSAPGHADEIEVMSWSHGFAQPASPSRGGGGSATHQNLTFTKYLDLATDDILKLCWGGKQIGKATLRCFRSDGAHDDKPVEYLRIVMEHVVISNYSISGGPGDLPVENVSLDYGVIQYTYIDQKHGDSSARHDLKSMSVT